MDDEEYDVTTVQNFFLEELTILDKNGDEI